MSTTHRQALDRRHVAAPAPAAVPAEEGLRSAIWQDMACFAELMHISFPSTGSVINLLLMPGMMATIVYRIAHKLNRAGLRPLSRLLYIWNVVFFSCDIAPGATIGPGFVMPHPIAVGIGKDCTLGRRVRVMGLVRMGGAGNEDPALEGSPTIGDECWLLDGCKVFGPVTVGDRVIIGAGSIVLDSIPASSVAAGVPARVVRRRGDAEG